MYSIVRFILSKRVLKVFFPKYKSKQTNISQRTEDLIQNLLRDDNKNSVLLKESFRSKL